MPFTSNSKNLPANVKKMPAKKRRQWAHVWSSVMKRSGNEGKAFRMANSVAGRKDLVPELTVEEKYRDLLERHTALLEAMTLEEPEETPELPAPAAEKSMSFMDKLKQVIGLGSPEPPAEPSMPSFSLKESPEGRLRFTTFATNNFEDQLGEIFPEEAHEEFIAWAYENKGFPELWPWHMYGERLGVVDTMAYTNGFLISSGLIDEGMEVKAKSWADDPNTAMSHGFFKRQVGSDIVRYREFEQSVLPRWAACNPWTDFTVGAKEMALTDEKRREFAEKGYTPEEITALDTMTAGFRDKLKAAGVAFKDITDEDSAPAGETPPTAQPETPPAPAAPAAPTGGLTLEDIRAAIRDELAANTEIAALKEQIAGFKGGADDYFANLWKSRGAQPQVPASKSESNIVSGKESEAAKNPAAWINDVPLFEHPIFRNGRVG